MSNNASTSDAKALRITSTSASSGTDSAVEDAFIIAKYLHRSDLCNAQVLQADLRRYIERRGAGTKKPPVRVPSLLIPLLHSALRLWRLFQEPLSRLTKIRRKMANSKVCSWLPAKLKSSG